MTQAVATKWQLAEYVANGRSPLSTWPTKADQNAAFLAAHWRYVVTIPISYAGAGATDGSFPSGTPGQCRVRIPPWTKYIAWSAVGTAAGDVFAYRAEVDGTPDPGSECYISFDVTDGTRQYRTAYQVDTAEPDPQAFGALHTNIFDGDWHDITIEFYVDSTAAVTMLQFYPLPASHTGERIG